MDKAQIHYDYDADGFRVTYRQREVHGYKTTKIKRTVAEKVADTETHRRMAKQVVADIKTGSREARDALRRIERIDGLRKEERARV